MASARIVLADDNEELLSEIRNELEGEFEIVGTATNGQDAVDATSRLDPDFLALDISMPILNGLEAARRIRLSWPRTKIVFFTIYENEEYISAAFSIGASGYVTKRHLASDLAHAISEVAQGRTFVSPSLL